MAAGRPELSGGPFWDLEGMDGGKNAGWEGEKCQVLEGLFPYCLRDGSV